MGLSGFFLYVWDLVRQSFEDCTSCCDVLDPDYYRKTSPGVRRTPQQFNRWENDVKSDFTTSRPPSSLPPSSSSHAGVTTQRSKTSSSSRSDSPMNYSYEEEDDDQQHLQFLFYGGSDPPTPTSTGGCVYVNGYRSDMISKYVQPGEPVSPAAIASPRINHEIPCFFSPRNTPQSPMTAPIYSPHLFRITEQQPRRSSGFYRSSYSR